MAASEQARVKEYQDNDVIDTESEGSDPGNDSDLDPSFCILEDSHAKFADLSIRKKSKSRIDKDLDVDVDENEEETVQKIIEVGQLEKLKVEQCKVYLRKNGLRLTGNKSTLIQRIKEHLDILNGEGEKKYPVSSFALNCKGDACTGDVVMFKQNVYERFDLASRSAGGPPCGERIVAGRIVKESYGKAKQQHTFTVEVLWSKGEKPLPPLHPLLIKGRNLYRLNTLRQRWEDENERRKVLMEKHSRGSLARSNREIRIQEKEKRKMPKENREPIEDDHPKKEATSRVQLLSQLPAVPQKPVKFCGIREFQPPQYDNIFFAERTNHIQPNFIANQVNWLSERTNHRQPLTSINNFHPESLPQRLGYEKQKMCKYYAKGRCYFGDNCKFSHDLREKL